MSESRAATDAGPSWVLDEIRQLYGYNQWANLRRRTRR
jgi:hypothetical protein